MSSFVDALRCWPVATCLLSALSLGMTAQPGFTERGPRVDRIEAAVAVPSNSGPTAPQGKVWLVVIGISDYQNPAIRDLEFARADALAVAAYYREQLQIPPQQIFVRTDHEATLSELKRLLGTELVNRTQESEDTIILYFAGHGKKEVDIGSQDHDGFSKYLLPYDANPVDLFSSALGMEEVVRILKRLHPERVALIIDACFSGAVGGGRSPYDPTEALRSGATDDFLARVASSGRGRVILTASSVDEVAWEWPELGHGIFTYFLLQGLRGDADDDADGNVDIDELYKFTWRQVSARTGGRQNPVKKAPNLIGTLVVGINAGNLPGGSN